MPRPAVAYCTSLTCTCCTASVVQVALVNGVPKTLSFRECLQHFLDFRVDVVQRRAAHALAKATARLHLVEGLLLALQQLDAVVQVCGGVTVVLWGMSVRRLAAAAATS